MCVFLESIITDNWELFLGLFIVYCSGSSFRIASVVVRFLCLWRGLCGGMDTMLAWKSVCLWVRILSLPVNSIIQLLSHVRLFVTPWTAACQASLSFTISWSLLKLMPIELVMASNHLVLCHPFLLLSSIFPSIGVFSDESALCIRWPKYWSFSFNISPFQWMFRTDFL